jgi:hypothetical protein
MKRLSALMFVCLICFGCNSELRHRAQYTPNVSQFEPEETFVVVREPVPVVGTEIAIGVAERQRDHCQFAVIGPQSQKMPVGTKVHLALCEYFTSDPGQINYLYAATPTDKQ